MSDKNYPIIIGNHPEGKPTKLAVGTKSQMGAGYDVLILGLKDGHKYTDECSDKILRESLDGRLYTTLHFCNLEALDRMIQCLQDTKALWEKEISHDKSTV